MSYSINTYTSDGTDVSFNVTFDYINKEDVIVYVNDAAVSFTWETDSTIKPTTTPSSGDIVTIKRNTQKDSRLVVFKDTASLSEDDLNVDSKQGFYITQEAFDSADACLSKNLTLKFFDAESKQIKNIADPTENQDVASKVYADTLYTRAVSETAEAVATITTKAEEVATNAALVASDTTNVVAQAAEVAAALTTVLGFTEFTPAWNASTPRSWTEKLGDIVSVFDFGAVGDGVTDDTAAIQAAIDYCASLPNGGSVVIPAPSAYYSVSRINAKSKVSIVIPNASTKIVQEKGTTWDTKTSLGVGGYFGCDYTTPTAYALNAITLGDKTATLSTASDAANFQVGDCVFIESTTYFTLTTTGTYTVPAFAQMNVVESVSGGVLTLRHPIQESRSSVQVRNFSRTGQHTLGGTQPLEAVRDFKLIGGTWINNYGSFNADGGCIDCEISPDAVEAVHGAPYGNCYSHTRFRVGRVISTGVPFALALAAHNTVVEIGHISCISPTTIQRLVELSEGCRDCTVHIGSISARASIEYAVEVIASRRNVVEIGTITAPSITGAASHVWNPAYSGTEIPPANNNTISINSIISPSIAGGSLISGTSTEKPSGNIVSIFCSGSVTTDESCSNSGRNIVDVKTQRRQTLERLQFDEFPFSVTSTSAYTKTTTIPAGIVRTGDRLNIRIRGISTGAAGTKTISITFAGVTMYSYTIPAVHLQGIDIDFILNFAYDSVAMSNTTAIQEGVANSDDLAASGLSLATTAYNLVVSITCAAAGDVVAIRQMSMNVSKKTIQ